MEKRQRQPINVGIGTVQPGPPFLRREGVRRHSLQHGYRCSGFYVGCQALLSGTCGSDSASGKGVLAPRFQELFTGQTDDGRAGCGSPVVPAKLAKESS